ncbi:MAG: DNA translocase FtsK [Treponema sp.]|nr:DNA translocase FtsK [Treponema sp.]
MRYDRFRIITIAAAAALGFLSFFLGISIAGALLKYEGNLYGAGYFFSRSYGLLALIIPAYLFSAAFILADPAYHPARIFLLSSCIVPFFTLASGFRLLRDFNVFSIRYPLLALMGRTGFTFIILFFLTFEFLIIFALKSLLFPVRQEKPEKKGEAVKPEGVLSLPSPGEAVILREIYAEAAAANPYEEKVLPERVEPEKTAVHEDDGEKDEEKDDEEDETETVEEVEELAPVFESVPPVKSKPVPKSPVTKASYFVPADILNQYPDGQYWIIDDATRRSAITLRETLEEFKIQAEVTGIRKGPVITMFEILPAPGVKLSRIVNLQDNIALRLAASSVRIVAPIPGKHAVGIEVPNAKRNIVSFREIIEGELGREGKKGEIPVVLGKDITGEAQTIDLTQMPHLLIAGATGSGKSVCVNAMILSILYQRQPAECRLILIDPKIVELKLYNDIPHLLTPVITEPKRAFQALQYCICEMERRYACLDSMGVRDIKSYNRRIRERNIAAEHIPYIVIVVDEFADLMATTGKELESTLARLAAMSRAVGIHLVLATQRPSIDVITGLIKANIPSRIAFMVASKMDSRIIIDMVGAEKLLGKGDMLYAGAVDPFPIRMQGAFVSEEEVEAVVEHVKTLGQPDYIDDEIFYDEEEDEGASLFTEGEDPLYDKALEIVLQQGKASASYIQRRLKIGYNRAARLVEEMEVHGVVGPAQGSKPRELLRGV